jgi:hypothetical protein
MSASAAEFFLGSGRIVGNPSLTRQQPIRGSWRAQKMDRVRFASDPPGTRRAGKNRVPYTQTVPSAIRLRMAKNCLGGGTHFRCSAYGRMTLFFSNVTAVCESSLPLTHAPVFMAINVLDKTIPCKCAVVPMSTRPATCQNTFLLCAPPIR